MQIGVMISCKADTDFMNEFKKVKDMGLQFYKRLMECGYTGPFTIEHEIKGDKQISDIVKARDMLVEIEKNYTK